MNVSSFMSSFKQDPEFGDLFRQVVDKPIFRDASVRHTIRDDGLAYMEKPSPRATSIDVIALCEAGKGPGDHHKNAWIHFVENAQAYETTLTARLWVLCRANYESFLAAQQELDPAWLSQGDWPKIKSHADFGSVESLALQVDLDEVLIFNSGLSAAGFISFEFRAGWDEEHGCCVIMHEGRVLAVGQAGDFANRGKGVIDSIKYAQQLDNHPSDFRL